MSRWFAAAIIGIVLCGADSVRAAAQVWAQRGAGSDSSVVVESGGRQGAALVLTVPNSAGTYHVSVDILVSNNAIESTRGLTAYRSVFLRHPDDAGMMLGSAVNVNPMGWTWTNGAGVSQNQGSILVNSIGYNRNAGEQAINASHSPQTIYVLNLLVTKEEDDAIVEHRVWGAVSLSLWAQLPLTDNFVYFGANGPVPGATPVWTDADRAGVIANMLPMVVIRSVPEPGAGLMVLLAVAGMACRRRRPLRREGVVG